MKVRNIGEKDYTGAGLQVAAGAEADVPDTVAAYLLSEASPCSFEAVVAEPKPAAKADAKKKDDK